MKIAMFTNTYLPHVGGVARSVSTYEEEFRRRGHDVRIIAPEFEDAAESTDRVLRTPAVQKFNGSDFSVRIPQPGLIAEFLDSFEPEIIHSHHPFLLGDAALRSAFTRRLPIVFTHHTMYEQYTRYVPLDSEALQRVAIQMAIEYCNMCTHVIAPSPSIAGILVERQVTTPITAIPTGIDLALFGSGDGRAFRERFGIARDTLVVGHVGRLAGEKNLGYLAAAVGRFLAAKPQAAFLVIGAGEFEEQLKETIGERAAAEQLVLAGKHTGRDLADAYAAMDVFAFSSMSETQGMVLAEAMAARTPVVALDAPGARDVVVDGKNGRLLPADTSEPEFAIALDELTQDRAALKQMGDAARESVHGFGLEVCADRMLELYAQLIKHRALRRAADYGAWDRLRARLEIEWDLLVEKTSALAAAVVATDATRRPLD